MSGGAERADARVSDPNHPTPLIVAITGGSGAIYALRLLQVLLDGSRDVFLSISPSGADVIAQELGVAIDLSPTRVDLRPLLSARLSWSEASMEFRDGWQDRLTYCHFQDYFSPIASGSFLSGGMVVCPCSGGTLSGIARSASGNLITRAAEVQLKERRKLVLVPRETPLSVIAIENMHRAAAAGAILLPASPGWYHGVQCIEDLVDFVVARILDQLDIEHTLARRWGDP